MKKIILIITLAFSVLLGQQRSIIFNTGNPAYTCNDAGGSYSNYTCDDECDQLINDYCTILLEGHTIDSNNTLADKFSTNNNYALEAFGIYLKLHPDSNPLLDHSATIKIHSDNNDSPGDVLGEWAVEIGNGYYYSLYVGDGCIDLEENSSYWISAHTDNNDTQLIWLNTQIPFYTFAQTNDNGITWNSSEFGTAGAAAIWAEQIYYTDWQPAETESADVNLDGTTNVLDVVQLVQFVLGNLEFSEEQMNNSDFNNDDFINILDVVSIVNLILNGNTVEPMPGFSLEDINPASDYYGEHIGPETFRGDVSLYYFGKAGWSHCRHRFGVLNDLFLELESEGITDVSIVGINGYQYINDDYSCMICDDLCTSSTCDDGARILPWVQDLDFNNDDIGDVWNEWDATIRDLVFLNRDGVYVTRVNLTSYNPDPDGMGECTDNYDTIKQLILDLLEE